MCVCPHGLADPFLQSTWEGPRGSPELRAEGGLCSGNTGDFPVCPDSVIPDQSSSRGGWIPVRPPCSLAMLCSVSCGAKAFHGQCHFFWNWGKVPGSWSWKSKVDVSSLSCNKVPEVEEGLLTSEDIKSPNFQKKSSPSAAGMVVRQPDLFFLCSRPLLFPLSLPRSL